jgi:HD-GYP domain-containing protein (c-di-GMP phosphodiesterase class II)
MTVDLTESEGGSSEPQSPKANVVSPPSPPRKEQHVIPPSPSVQQASVHAPLTVTTKKTTAFKANVRKSRMKLPYKKRRPSLTTQERCSSSQKRVRFQHDPASKRLVRKVIYGRVTLTNEEKKQLWWDKQIKKSTRRAIRRYQSGGSSSVSSVNKNNAKEVNYNSSSDDDERSVTSLSRHDFAEKYRQALDVCSSAKTVPLPEDIPTISDTPIRGLEHRIFPETVMARQEVVKKVVAAQRKLPPGLTADQQSKLLRAASQNLTRKSRMLARLYGIGDAQVATSTDLR